MNRRALVVAAVVCLLGVALLYVYLRRFEEEASGGAQVHVLVVRKTIEAGKPITEEILATRAIPRAYLEDRAVLESERSKVIGLKVGHSVRVQQTLLWTDLEIAEDERRNLSSLVQPGMRALPVRAGIGVEAALIRPGDRVDVIATLPQQGGHSSQEKVTITLLQKVLVLAVGRDTTTDAADAPTRMRDSVFSLSVTEAEARRLSLAMVEGRLTVALRNPDDIRRIEGTGEVKLLDLMEAPKSPHVPRPTGPVQIPNPGRR